MKNTSGYSAVVTGLDPYGRGETGIIVIDRRSTVSRLQKEMTARLGDMGLDSSAVIQADMGIRAKADYQRQVGVTVLAYFIV